jgi:hypothetical protein
MNKEEQKMLREVFKYKFDIIENSINEIRNNDELREEIKPLLTNRLIEEKSKYMFLQNELINSNSDIL